MHTRSPRTNRFLLAAFVTGVVAVVAPACWGQLINEDRKLLPVNPGNVDEFGHSIAIDNGIAAVGARRRGSAFLFDSSTGVQLAELIPIEGRIQDWFGNAIAIDSGVVAVGSWGMGAAYLFDVSTGAQFARLTPSDGLSGKGYGIGSAIAIDNGIVAVGARADDDNGIYSGSAYLFDASTGAQLLKLLPTDGAISDAFGTSIDIDNGIVAIGAPGDDDNGKDAGSAYLFDASTGTQIAKLLPTNGEESLNFGYSIAIKDGIVAVGAFRGSDNGSVYLFDASTGVQIGKLHPAERPHQFGFSIAIDSGVIAVGANADFINGNMGSGSAYLFDAFTGVQIAKLGPSDAQVNGAFGFSIAIDNGIVAVGQTTPMTVGSAYIFTVPTDCPADFNGDGVVNTLDFLAFLNAWTTGDPRADWNGDGIINSIDFLAYLNAFEAGC